MRELDEEKNSIKKGRISSSNLRSTRLTHGQSVTVRGITYAIRKGLGGRCIPLEL